MRSGNGVLDRVCALSGVSISKASCGLTLLYSLTKESNFLCCDFKSYEDGLAQAAFKSRCIRSCRPFCSGWAGSENTGKIPNSINQYDNLVYRCIDDTEPKGPPLSVCICLGIPYLLNILVNSAFADLKFSLVCALAVNRYLLLESAIVNGWQYFIFPILNFPL